MKKLLVLDRALELLPTLLVILGILVVAVGAQQDGRVVDMPVNSCCEECHESFEALRKQLASLEARYLKHGHVNTCFKGTTP